MHWRARFLSDRTTLSHDISWWLLFIDFLANVRIVNLFWWREYLLTPKSALSFLQELLSINFLLPIKNNLHYVPHHKFPNRDPMIKELYLLRKRVFLYFNKDFISHNTWRIFLKCWTSSSGVLLCTTMSSKYTTTNQSRSGWRNLFEKVQKCCWCTSEDK